MNSRDTIAALREQNQTQRREIKRLKDVWVKLDAVLGELRDMAYSEEVVPSNVSARKIISIIDNARMQCSITNTSAADSSEQP